jgi:hypothetical protein
MMMNGRQLLYAGCLLVIQTFPLFSQNGYIPVCFEGNGNLQTDLLAAGDQYPKGYSTLNGVPFQLTPEGNNFWSGALCSESDPCTLFVPVDLDGVDTVFTLMNLYWGDTEETLASIEFFGSEAGYHKVDLYANRHVRDFDSIPPEYADSIDPAFAVEVFNNDKGQRLDCQWFDLPEEFTQQKLTGVRIVDKGESNLQRLFIYGLTVKLVTTTGGNNAFEPVPFEYNGRLQDDLLGVSGPGYPCGDTIFEGVPFSIPAEGENWWHAVAVSGENPHVLEVPVNRFGVREIYTLINLYWGVHGDSTRAAVTVVGAKGEFTVALFTGRHIRDFDGLGTVYENEIDSAITTEIYNNNAGQRLDMQRLILPAQFLGDTLKKIRFIDSGESNIQRMFVYGITVSYAESSVTTTRRPLQPMGNHAHNSVKSVLLDGRSVAATDRKSAPMVRIRMIDNKKSQRTVVVK